MHNWRRANAFAGQTVRNCREPGGWIIAQRRDGFQCHVASPLDGPFIVLLE